MQKHERKPLTLLIEQATAIMKQDFSYLGGIQELAEQLTVTPEHLARTFHEQVGSTPLQYLTQLRIESAKALLVQYDYKIEVIANLCGYRDANYFCKVFRKHTHSSPAAFRKANAVASVPVAFERDFEAF